MRKRIAIVRIENQFRQFARAVGKQPISSTSSPVTSTLVLSFPSARRRAGGPLHRRMATSLTAIDASEDFLPERRKKDPSGALSDPTRSMVDDVFRFAYERRTIHIALVKNEMVIDSPAVNIL
jgi:hypothetical protein